MYDDDAEHWVGKTFAGTWWIERVLGTGGMGSVLLGRAADGSQVALKVLHPELNAIAEVRKRFLREGFIGNTFGGADAVPGVVRVLGSGESPEGLAYLTMEVLQGETLFDRMARTGTMPAGEVLALADQVLETLAIAHARGVVHRDLKPENIHLGNDGRVRMLDFGIARVVDGLTGLPEKTATKTGMIMGTATYMAPEQATGLIHDIDGRTDLFGLGATMFRLLSGRQVHGDVTEAMEVIAAATEPPPPLASVAPGISPAVAAVVDRSLAFIKFHRYPNAETMRADVRAVRAGGPPPYAQAVLEGRIRAGQPLSQPAPPLTPSPGGVSPSARPQPTVMEPAAVPGHSMSRPERTLDDSATAPSAAGTPLTQWSTGKLLLLVGGASLATGIIVAVIVVLLLLSC
ncbi:protein kinase [Sorangium sp. So ce260]|uniref:serine/threonine-protein kinase n=1 Tax=Sorangium sp. So ce260 TaxID=3133291 RepID=UPI003F624460